MSTQTPNNSIADTTGIAPRSDDYHKLPGVEEDACWLGFSSIYPILEKAAPYQRLVHTMANAMDPKSGEKWLDAGCGSGAMTEIIFRRTDGQCKVIAIDSSQTMLTHLRHRGLALLNGELMTFKADLRYPLPLESNYFDGVVGNLVFCYIDRWYNGQKGINAIRCCLQEMHRLLRPGGRIVWSTPRKDPEFIWVFLASWRAWLFSRSIFRDGKKILGYAQELKKRAAIGRYGYLNQKEILNLMRAVGFSNTNFKKTYARQGWVVSGNKI